MHANEATLLTLAGAVADGSDVDWEHAESSAADAVERNIVQQLRVLANLGAAARTAVQSWGPLQIRSEVGRGSFGTVYRAWDTRLDREVALKLMPAQASSHSAVIVKEGRLLAQIRHPNVVTVYGADVIDGFVGIWTEFVTGRTLKDIVQEHGPFGAHEAALIGRDLCRALAAVHKLGFLHRDVKAQNVMREAGGRTVLMDFGTGDAAVTAAAPPLAGTPVYLAPELLDGAAPTSRSDLYSLGVLLFYLVTGEFPVTASSLEQLRAHHAQGRRQLLRDVRPDVPAAFVRVVDRATAADPGERPETAGALEALLDAAIEVQPGKARPIRRHLAYALVALIVIVTAAVAITTPWSTAPAIRRTSVAILPFTNLSAEADNEYFSAGVTDDITSQLSTLREIRVIGRTAVSRRDGGNKSAAEIGRELGVEAVVHGSVRRSGDRVRIVGQLLDARTGEQLWSDTFDRSVEDIFVIQSEVSRKIAIALKGELSIAEAGWLSPRAGENVDAYMLYLKGRYQWRFRSEDGFRQSLQLYEQALRVDPNYARAYAGLADTYSQMRSSGTMPKEEAAARATAAASKAITLDPSLAEAHAALGYIQKNRFEWLAADRSFRRAIELQPGYAPAHHWYSILLGQHGRFPEAISEIKSAMALDPLSTAAQAQLGALLLLARRFDDAVTQYERVLAMDATYAAAHQVLGEVYAYRGEYERALASYRTAARVGALGREDHELQADIGYALAKAGRRQEALAILSELLARDRSSTHGTAANIATIHAALGNNSEAMKWLAIAHQRRDPEIGYLKVDPRWDSLRQDTRFIEMLRTLEFAVE